jgi:hypothetical protein
VLTSLERHASYSAYRLHRLIKLLVFRVCNTQSLFLVRYFADVPFYPCMATRAGNQAFVMVLLDLTVSNVAEIGFSAAYNAAHRWQKRRAAATGAKGKFPEAAIVLGPARANSTARPTKFDAKSMASPMRAASQEHSHRTNDMRQQGGPEAMAEEGGGDSGSGDGYFKGGVDDVERGSSGEGKGKDHLKREDSAEEAVSEIEMTDDYLELLYRQYVMLACMSAFPLVTVPPLPYSIDFIFSVQRVDSKWPSPINPCPSHIAADWPPGLQSIHMPILLSCLSSIGRLLSAFR